jgi:hypothetical protein
VKKPRHRGAVSIRAIAYGLFLFTIYLGGRAINRSLYASDYEYLHPSSVLDEPLLIQPLIVAVFSGLLALARKLEVRGIRPLIADRADEDAAIRRRRDAKRFNERLKLLANGLNAIGASTFLALFIVPTLTGAAHTSSGTLYGLVVAMLCHVCGQFILSLWKTEE